MMEDFRARQSAALQRRLGGTGLTAKVLAHAVGVHADTVLNWARGQGVMDGAAIEAVDAFFASRGDWGFLAELYGDWRARAMQRAAQLETHARRLREHAALLGGRDVA